jgi:hypothetical protein
MEIEIRHTKLRNQDEQDEQNKMNKMNKLIFFATLTGFGFLLGAISGALIGLIG